MFQFVDEFLQPYAQLALSWGKSHFGIIPKSLEYEVGIRKIQDFAPTISGRSKDFHILCIEVSNSIIRPVVESFISECRRVGLPVKLYIAIPDTTSHDFQRELRRAKELGIGVISFSLSSAFHIWSEPLSQSLVGLREIPQKGVPVRVKPDLENAYNLFLNGRPDVACHDICSLLESECRLFACKLLRKGTITLQRKDIDKMSWMSLTKHLISKFGDIKLVYRNLEEPTLHAIVAITSDRNDVAHRIQSIPKLVERDHQLKTRFEHICDITICFLKTSR